jgi:Protein of unknown function (DUF2752)
MIDDNYIGPKQHGLLLGCLLVAALLLACFPTTLLGMQYQCALHRITGLRCPFCGMTRDFILMSRGSFPRNNPGSLLLAAALYLAYPAWLLRAARRGGSALLVSRDRVIQGLVIVMALLFLCNNLAVWGRV